MADNVIANPGAGGSTFRTDDVGSGVQVPFAKLMDGTDGSSAVIPGDATLGLFVQVKATTLPTGAATEATIAAQSAKLPATLGQKAMTASLAVALASDQSALPITDNSGSLTIDSPQLAASLGQKAMAASNAVVIASDQSALPITDNSGSLTVDSGQLPATLGQKAMAASMAVVLASDQASVPVAATLAAETTKVIGTINIAAAQSVAVTNAGTFATQAAGTKTNNNAAPGATNIGALPAVANAAAPTQTEANLVALRTTLSGDLAITLDSEAVILGAGAAVIGALTANQSVNVAQINGATATMGNGVSGTGVQRVTLASDSTGQAISIGAAAHGASIAGAPVRKGLRALTGDYTALTTGQTADSIATVLGKQINLPYCLPGQAWKYVGAAGGLVNNTAITIAAAAGAGIKNYITSITLVNSHQTIGTEVIINDGAAGTAIFRTWCQFAGGGCSVKLDPPIASTANTLLEIKEVTATATAGIVAMISGYTAAE